MTYCACHACRARDDRRFWRIVRAHEWNDPPATLAARVGAYGYTPILNLPPIPEWTGEPTEWRNA
jgi:hypothetical protein